MNKLYYENQRTSLVIQWLKICLPMQGTWVRSLVGKLHVHVMLGNKDDVPQTVNLRSLESAYHNYRVTQLSAARERLCAAVKTQCSQR